jgi:hypothetical protein
MHRLQLDVPAQLLHEEHDEMLATTQWEQIALIIASHFLVYF